MSYFLWVEDFENSPKVTANDVFGGVLVDKDLFDDNKQALRKKLSSKGVFVELNFQDGYSFITQKLKKIDFIILDIDLPAAYSLDEINEEVLGLLSNFENYQKHQDETEDETLLKKACDQLKKIAGFYMYTKLVVELGFPKQHILFCSNHGENTQSIQDAFKTAKIALPKIHQKSDSDVQRWVKSCYENSYSRLRRGILEGCSYLKNLPEDRYRFKGFIKDTEKQPSVDDLHNYLDVLAGFFPLREPETTVGSYKLFIRTLAHEWEAAEPQKLNNQNELYAFSWIMKMTRNWSAHSKIFEQLKPEDVAYLFIVNMRAMFDLGDALLPHENHLLGLFGLPINLPEMHEKIGSDHKSRQIPLVEHYAVLLKKTGNTWQAINFHDALNNLQKHKENEINNGFLIQGLYQTFWFLTSSGSVYIPSNEDQIKSFSVLNYQFRYFDYHKSKEDYLYKLASHIYIRSFPQGDQS